MCGMSVVDGQYEQLKRFNIAELGKPPPAEQLGEEAKET
jgi:hypothetical protein